MTNPDQPTVPNRVTPYDPPTQETIPMRAMNPALPTARPAASPRMPQSVPAVRVPPAPPVTKSPRPLPRKPARMSSSWRWALVGGLGLLLLTVVMVFGVAVAAIGNNVLPGVSVAGVRVGGQTVDQVTRLLSTQSQRVTLTANGQEWGVAASELGLRVDARASAQRAFAMGREEGNFWDALIGRVSVPLVVSFDIATAEAYLLANEATFAVPAVDASVVFVNGDVQATPPQDGSVIDIQATLARLLTDPAAALENGLVLSTVTVAPMVTDVSPALNAARALLANPMELRVFDPVTGSSVYWSAPPEQWGQWLTAVSDPSSPIGLSLQVEDAPLRSFLAGQASVFDPSRTIDMDQAVSSVQAGLAQGDPRQATVMVKHLPRQYTVRSGDTLTSIAWEVGMPYPYIQQVNGGRDRFSVGETITIPPADSFLLVPPVANKRIVVSISQQRVWVYENDQLLHEWVASTGISDSPTWRGVYQVILRERNAYAGNWDLHMPYFIGVYRPIPGAAFTNGFHGFPTRGGGQLLWENALGRRVTYGCILINNQNAAWLYEWADEGVVVEIQG